MPSNDARINYFYYGERSFRLVQTHIDTKMRICVTAMNKKINKDYKLN